MDTETAYELNPTSKGRLHTEVSHEVTQSPSQTRRLDRYLKTLPTLAFAITLVASWEATAVGFQAGLLNGGPASLIWGFLVSGPGTLMIVLSLAEMASITPSVGAQYRWTAIYCPKYLPKAFFSFLQGWLTVFAWIASATMCPYFAGSQICGLLTLGYPDYVYKGWHCTLIGYAIIAVTLTCNIFARRLLRSIEIVGAVLHFIFFVVVVVVLITLGGRNSASYVFTGDSGGVSGWTNPVISWCIGLLSAVFPLTGFDGVLHLSDEVKNPEKRIPKAMVMSFLVNVFISFGFMLCLLFFMGDPAARRYSATSALMCMIIVPGMVAYFNNMASVTRLSWAFARDDGLPFSDYFKVVHPKLRAPLRALGLTTVITMLLLLIPIWSYTAFNAILSLSVTSLYFSYTMPCVFVFLQRLGGEDIARSDYALGRWGIWVNGAASVYGVFIIIWLCFPSELPVTAANMNWSGPIMGFVIIFALVDWMVRGRRKFSVSLDKRQTE